ncbi:hypothetical protein ACJ73_02495 [Blastomyces percursus]|uniref:Uncharacterized protein n=1 Tax=Blastomyces percursus TaxID=1658174 RepID=A0A1J9RDP8_9EURO|nr:hypothetical protein ACJ73_02495 [Blastomyces percursus]
MNDPDRHIAITPPSLRSTKKRALANSPTAQDTPREAPQPPNAAPDPPRKPQRATGPISRPAPSSKGKTTQDWTVPSAVESLHFTGNYKLSALLGQANDATSAELASILEHCNKISGHCSEEETEDDFYQKTPDTPPSAEIYPFEDYLKTPRNEWREQIKPFEDEERLTSLFNRGKAESLDFMTSQQNFAPNPDLYLNVGLKKRKMSWYIAASIFGIFLQSGVLVWAAIARYYYKFLRDDLEKERSSRVLGMGRYQLRVSRLRITISRPQILPFIGSSSSAGRYSHNDRGTIIPPDKTLSNRVKLYLADRPEFYEGHELDWLSLNIGNLGRYGRFGWTISTARYHRAGELSKERRKIFDENRTLQNGPSVYQPKIKGKSPQVNTRTTYEALSVQCENNHLLSGFRLVRGDNHKLHANQVSENWPCIPRLGIQPNPPNRSDALPFTECGSQISAEGLRDHVQFLPESLRAALIGDQQNIGYPTRFAKTLLYRARLARLASNWEDRLLAVRNIARSLVRAIEDTVKVLFTTDVVFEHRWHESFSLLWAVPCSPDHTRPTVDFKLESSPWASVIERRENDRNIYLSLRRKIDVDGNSEGRWRVDEAELEAVLGIWLWSLRQSGTNGLCKSL